MGRWCWVAWGRIGGGRRGPLRVWCSRRTTIPFSSLVYRVPRRTPLRLTVAVPRTSITISRAFVVAVRSCGWPLSLLAFLFLPFSCTSSSSSSHGHSYRCVRGGSGGRVRARPREVARRSARPRRWCSGEHTHRLRGHRVREHRAGKEKRAPGSASCTYCTSAAVLLHGRVASAVLHTLWVPVRDVCCDSRVASSRVLISPHCRRVWLDVLCGGCVGLTAGVIRRASVQVGPRGGRGEHLWRCSCGFRRQSATQHFRL